MAEFKCESCGAEFDSKRQLHAHRLGKHRKEQPPKSQSKELNQQPHFGTPSENTGDAGKTEKADPLEKLKALGIQPDEAMAILSPLVEASVVQMLEKMQLGEAINKKVSEVETKLSGQIKQTLEPLQQAAGQSSEGEQPQNTQLRDKILATLAQKFIGGDSGGSLDSLLAQQIKIGQLVEAFTKPYRDAEEATLKRVNLMLGIGAKAGLTPKETLEKTQGIE